MVDEEARFATWKRAVNIADSVSAHIHKLDSEAFRRAVASTLCADCSWSGERLATSQSAHTNFWESVEAFERFYQHLLTPEEAERRKAAGQPVWVSWSLSWQPPELEEYGAEPLLRKTWPFAMALQEAQRGRKFMMLSNGDPALVPWDAQTGDVLILVEGAKVPFLVRPIVSPEKNKPEKNGDLWNVELVGDCFVHGMMDGEWLLPASAEGPDAEKLMVHNENGQSYIAKPPKVDGLLKWEQILVH